ncbi:hypothetical protein [Traorella massiliensis]|uniref:hypothetical protein n=1 Tax=Traorella massiliensis TaxID=1903263 RepID=UPI0008F96132|nr:hypothetical protein [Traorella massiliensis]
MLDENEMNELRIILNDHNELFEKIQADQQQLDYLITKEKIRKSNIKKGIASAKAAGISFGRPFIKINKKTLDSVIDLYNKKKVTSREAAHMMGVSQSKFLRLYKEYGEEKSNANK